MQEGPDSTRDRQSDSCDGSCQAQWTTSIGAGRSKEPHLVKAGEGVGRNLAGRVIHPDVPLKLRAQFAAHRRQWRYIWLVLVPHESWRCRRYIFVWLIKFRCLLAPIHTSRGPHALNCWPPFSSPSLLLSLTSCIFYHSVTNTPHLFHSFPFRTPCN